MLPTSQPPGGGEGNGAGTLKSVVQKLLSSRPPPPSARASRLRGAACACAPGTGSVSAQRAWGRASGAQAAGSWPRDARSSGKMLRGARCAA